MFDQFVKQVTKLFSSKRNGGKLVYSLTDRLHCYKQIWFSISIIFLLGYSQFRNHFHCQGTDRVDSKTMTNQCWMNGTETLHRINASSVSITSLISEPKSKQHAAPARKHRLPPGISKMEQTVPHVGLHFNLDADNYEVVNHNYMRSSWGLLVFMAACSYVASRQWSNIFANDLMRALLRLPGNEELPFVEEAQRLKLASASSQDNDHKQTTLSLRDVLQFTSSNQNQDQDQMLVHKIDLLGIGAAADDQIHYDLDYYPKQLIYMLDKQMKSLLDLKLRRRLLWCSFCSLTMTVLQFVAPLIIIGPHYAYFGWNYANSALKHIIEQIRAYPRQTPVNSYDYELSSAIFPTAVQCQYELYGLNGLETHKVRCLSPINEISAKMFFVIWWFVVLNIVIELCSFVRLLCCSLNFRLVRWTFGRRFWPRAQQEAKLIGRFRSRRANLRASLGAAAEEAHLELEAITTNTTSDDGHNLEIQISRANSGQQKAAANKQVLSARERKRLEAEQDKEDTLGNSSDSLRAKRWYLWCSRDICLYLADKCKQMSSCRNHHDFKAATVFSENGHDPSLFYLFYLLYLRFDCSRKKVEQVIQVSNKALTNQLESWEHEWSTTRSGPMSSSTTSTTIVPSSVATTLTTGTAPAAASVHPSAMS